ncbi:MAG: hypothetical protein JWQ42_3947 [Edaphobacter sp.]|nr:hypothetical protein [Edaphobacter sp.]
MQGFIQFITGVYLLVGLTWFNVFGKWLRYIWPVSPSRLHRFKSTVGWLDGQSRSSSSAFWKLTSSGVPATPRNDYFRRLDIDLRYEIPTRLLS